MFRSRDIQVFAFSTTHDVTKLGQLIDINKGNNFQESSKQLGRLGLSSRSLKR